MNIHAVIFDRDNTLVHYDADAVAALEARVAAIGPVLPPGALIAHWNTWRGPWPRTEAEEPTFWRLFWQDFAARYGLDMDAVTALEEVSAFYHTSFAAFPDTISCLQALRSRGIHLAVLTNFELPSIWQTLEYTGLDPSWFTALLSSTALGVRKPDPRAYLAAAAALGLSPAACMFIDDLPVNVIAAEAVGMRGVLLDRGHSAESGSLERIHDLHALTALLS